MVTGMQRVFAFVEGAHLRAHAKDVLGFEYLNPKCVAGKITTLYGPKDAVLIRVNHYDAEPDEKPTAEKAAEIAKYHNEIEVISDVQLRFGSLRGKENRRTGLRQKGVDVLLAVDLVVGSFTRIFDCAIIVSGDADFIPAIQEAQRRGVVVIGAGFDKHTSHEFIAQCDRFCSLDEHKDKIVQCQHNFK